MLQNEGHFHGSDLEKVEQAYGIKKEEITSFSANVNPLGISDRLRETLAGHIDAISTYPDREYTSLRKCIAEYVGTNYGNIVIGNGSSELISLFIRIRRPKKAMVIGPTYSEYEREIALSGGECLYYPLPEEQDFVLDVGHFTGQLNGDIDLLVICNPNNPTSGAITRESMREILSVCEKNGIFVLVDETYVEFADNEKEITSVPLADEYGNLAILRGVSKFFAAPGLRLGYAVTGNRGLIETVNTRMSPWAINSLAAIAGEILFRDADYQERTRKLISTERKRVSEMFRQDGRFHVYPPAANFMLVRLLPDGLTAGVLFERAIREKMMIRDCSTFPFLNDKFIRFCFMKPEMNDRLAACLMR